MKPMDENKNIPKVSSGKRKEKVLQNVTKCFKTLVPPGSRVKRASWGWARGIAR